MEHVLKTIVTPERHTPDKCGTFSIFSISFVAFYLEFDMLTFTRSNSTIETLETGVKYVQS